MQSDLQKCFSVAYETIVIDRRQANNVECY